MNKKLRRYKWLLLTLFGRYRKMILWSFFGGLLIFIVIARFTPFLLNELSHKTTVMGVVGSYNPTTLPITVQKLISTGLTDVAEGGEVLPGVATSWEIS